MQIDAEINELVREGPLRGKQTDTGLSIIGHEFNAVVERSIHGGRMPAAASGRDRIGRLAWRECPRALMPLGRRGADGGFRGCIARR
ncbi:hypothetical protein Ato02nite_078930 [Paractinoplanes toevensis]|uniref:Uncharacterized protein n=1 Tax=Paractinoplanes toevensis TaxID=571911 RepID=A0A919W9J1_9ACTN|nr:hypothetical protein Ato02nite_078930 [Actinoplanes toevensis]